MPVTATPAARRALPSAAFDARQAMGRAVAALDARGVPEPLRLAVAVAWLRVLATVEVEYLDGLRLLADAEAENVRLRAEVERLRAGRAG